MLSDPGNQVADKFGVKYKVDDDLRALYLSHKVDLAEYSGEGSWTLPMPTRIIVSSDGIIRYIRVNPDYRDRVDPVDTLAEVKKILEARPK